MACRGLAAHTVLPRLGCWKPILRGEKIFGVDSLASKVQGLRTGSMFRGVFANLRSGQDSAQSPETTVPSAWAPPAESITAHKSVPSEADLEEVEGLLRRATGTVRGLTAPPRQIDETAEVPPVASSHPPQKGAHTSPGREAGLTELPSFGAKRAPTSRLVQIHYDPAETAYVARDFASGLIVMQHQDREHLQGMCEWIGWRVVGGPNPRS
jgi:hypothetical protein